MPQKMGEKKKMKETVFVFTDSAKTLADIDVTRGKGCHDPLFPALP